jgi:hypothetical protein
LEKMKLTVTSLGKKISIQDPYPAEGQFNLDVDGGATESKNLSWSTLQRVSDQLVSMESSEAITWSVESQDGETRSQESDAAGLPQIALIDFSALTASGLTGQKMLGSNLIANQEFAGAVIGSAATPNASMSVRPVLPGSGGNQYSVTVIDTGSSGLAVTMPADEIIINLGGSPYTAAQVKTAADAAVGATFLFTQLGTGASNVVVQDSTDLEGGAGGGIQLTAAGVPCTITAIDEAATPQEIEFDIPSIAGVASAGDTARVVLRSGGKLSVVSVAVA